MNVEVRDTLKRVALVGGCASDRARLLDLLGPTALEVSKELRMVGLGCADESIVARISQVAQRP